MRKALVLLVPVVFAANVPGQIVLKSQGVTLAKNIEQTRYVDDANTGGWAGADVCAQEQSAEADLPSYGGTIDMRGLVSATFYSCSGTWTIGASKPVVLYLPLQAIVIAPTGNNAVITVANSSKIVGSNSSDVYNPGGSSRLQSSGTGTGDLIQWTGSNGVMEDVGIVSGGARSVLHLKASGTTSVLRNNFRNVQILGGTAGEKCLELTADNASALVSFNVFESLKTEQCDTAVAMDTTNNQGPTDNYLIGSNLENTLTCTAVISITNSTTASNHFIGGHTSGSCPSIVTGGTANTFEYLRTEAGSPDVNDTGSGNMFIGDSFSNCTTSTFDSVAVLLGNWSNTQCPFDQFPRAVKVGNTSLTSSPQAGATLQLLGNSDSEISIEAASAAVNEKWWDIINSAGLFAIRTINDNNTATFNALVFSRSGVTVTNTEIVSPVQLDSTLKVGNGSVINKILNGTATLNFGTVSAQTCTEQAITITGASTTNFGVSASPQSALGSVNLSWSAWVSGSNVVSVRVCNPSSANVTVNAVAWGATVNQ